MRELQHVGKIFHFLAGIKIFLRPVQPIRATGLRGKMPLDDFAQVGVEFFLRGFDGCLVN